MTHLLHLKCDQKFPVDDTLTRLAERTGRLTSVVRRDGQHAPTDLPHQVEVIGQPKRSGGTRHSEVADILLFGYFPTCQRG